MASLEDQMTKDLADLARDLSQNPNTRNDFLRLTQKVRPDVPLPEIAMEDAVKKAVAEETTKREALEKRLAEKEAKEELERRRQKLIADGKATLEEIPAIEKMMLEKGMTSHDSAAEFFQWQKQAAQPTSQPGYRPQVFDKDTRSKLTPFWKNPIQAARDEGMKALADLRRGRAAVN